MASGYDNHNNLICRAEKTLAQIYSIRYKKTFYKSRNNSSVSAIFFTNDTVETKMISIALTVFKKVRRMKEEKTDRREIHEKISRVLKQ